MQIYVIRHGLSEGNAAGVIQGYSDCELTEIGKSQASLLGRYFAREGILPEIIYASPLRRAFQTALGIAGQLDPVPHVEPMDALKEVDVGKLSGCSIEQAYEEFPDWAGGDVNRWLDFSAAGGESFGAFFERVSSSISDLMKHWDLLADRKIMFVTHAGAMRPLIKTLLDNESDMMFFSFGNCCTVRVEYRSVHDSIRKVVTDVIPIGKIAAIMGEKDPATGIEDSVGKKIG